MYDVVFFFFQAEDGIRDLTVTGVQTCALPISLKKVVLNAKTPSLFNVLRISAMTCALSGTRWIALRNTTASTERSEEHTSELQSQSNLVCRLLLEKKKKHIQQLQYYVTRFI